MRIVGRTAALLVVTLTVSHAQDDNRDKILFASETERPAALGKKLARNIWIDQKEIWTSPFHMHESDAKWWLIFGGATAALIATDRNIVRSLPNTDNEVRISNYISHAGAVYTTISIGAGFYGIGALVKNPKARETGILGLEAMLDSGIVVLVLKEIAQRERPTQNFGNGRFFVGGDSFPSGHSIAGWSLASVVAHEYHTSKLIPIMAYTLASVVSVSRVTGRDHFPSDVLASAGMGWFMGRYVYRTHMDHEIHRHSTSWASPAVAPMMGARSYGMSLVWSN
jgi:membrane-associated phospholipid phosphatase